MKRTVLAWLAVNLLAVAGALAVLPARWLMAVIPEHWPLAIVDASGTVWSGSAAVAIGPPQGRRRLPEPLRWRWSFSQGPKMTLAHTWLGGPLILALSPRGIMVSGQTLTLPAQALATLDARIAAVGPEGRLSLSWPATRLFPPAAKAGAPLLQAEWRNAASSLTPIRPLGHYTLSLTHAADGADLRLATLGGPLLLEGTGRLTRPAGLQFKGTAQADPSAKAATQAALQDILSALGPRKNNVTLLQHR